jgi:hypothetical protein
MLDTGAAGASTSISSGTLTLGAQTATLTSGNTITFSSTSHSDDLTAKSTLGTIIIKIIMRDMAKTSGTIYKIQKGGAATFTGAFQHCEITTLPQITATITATAKTVIGSASDAGYVIASSGGTCAAVTKAFLTADFSGKTIGIHLTY